METVETLEILDPGLLTTVQDRGRFGYGQYGVAASGALTPSPLEWENCLWETRRMRHHWRSPSLALRQGPLKI